MTRNESKNAIACLGNWLALSQDDVLGRFAALRRAEMRGQDHQRFVYVPGTRRDRVLLVAHADTVWDDEAGFPAAPVITNGVFRSASCDIGLGADDRAGCAMLWQLRQTGHSLLITCGEESGMVASCFIMECIRDVREDINLRHQFAVQFDRRNATDFKCYDVGTDEFRAYCSQMTGYTEPDRESATDICTLCRHICGVNLSVGYYDEHTVYETLRVADWLHTLRVAQRWLMMDCLPRFVRNGD